jgi:copper(I)-binding protein
MAMNHSNAQERLIRTSSLCDELAAVMSDIQHRLECRRTRMRENMKRMEKSLRIQSRAHHS